MSIGNTQDGNASKMLENLQNDLKTLCMETRKRYPHIKDVSEIILKKTTCTIAIDKIFFILLVEMKGIAQ